MSDHSRANARPVLPAFGQELWGAALAGSVRWNSKMYEGFALLGSDGATDPGTVARISGQLWYSVLVFVVLLLLGGLGVAVTRATGRRARGGAA